MVNVVVNLDDMPITICPNLDHDLQDVDISLDDEDVLNGLDIKKHAPSSDPTALKPPPRLPTPPPSPSFSLDTLRITKSLPRRERSPTTSYDPDSTLVASPTSLKRKAEEDTIQVISRRPSPSPCNHSACSKCPSASEPDAEVVDNPEGGDSIMAVGEGTMDVQEMPGQGPGPNISVQVKGEVVVAVNSSEAVTVNEKPSLTTCTLVASEQQSMRRLTFEWPNAEAGVLLATRSLTFLQAISNPFKGPLCPCHIRRRVASGGLQIDMQENWEGHCENYPTPLTDLVLGDFIMQGRIWSGFSATVANTGERLVAKFTSTSLAGAWVCNETHREAWIYHRLLRSLWGTVVPTWHGVHVGYQPRKGHRGVLAEVFCAVMEDAGEAVTEEEARALTEEEKFIVVDKYMALHRAGVVHRSAKYKHWMRRKGEPISSLRLIDFGSSIVRESEETRKIGLSSKKDRTFAFEAHLEIRKVCDMLSHTMAF